MRLFAMLLLSCAVLPACRAHEAPAAARDAAGAEAAGADAAEARADPLREQTDAQGTRIATIASGLDHPWAVALLPDGRFLVTERAGRMRYVSATGALSKPLRGVPDVWAHGQGGLLDVALTPGFARDRRICFTYAEPGPGGAAGTAAACATLGDEALTDVRVIYRQQPKLEGPNHFGSRLAFDGHGHVFISQGERFQRTLAQDLSKLQGKLVRVNLDGSIPADNPFVGQPGARPETWSYGHRNSQGLAIDPRTGTLWESEHGPRGGDELNLPAAGKNYGWPVASDGNDYGTDRPYPETRGTAVPGTVPPYHVWPVSPGLSGMAFLTGHPASPWNDSLFLGALADGSLIRLSLDGDRITGEERLLQDLRARVRDVRVAADGSVYVLTDASDGMLLRLRPPSS